MKPWTIILLLFASTVVPFSGNAKAGAADPLQLTPIENHHVIELDSVQPYVAGYHVDAPDLYTREVVEAAALTASFPSADTAQFPSDSWLGAGMFIQGQDSKLKNVDYGYYTMLVLDSSGNLFVDVGLHQTRESTAPIQMPTSNLVYAYTWQISGTSPETPITLVATWDSDEYLHYSLLSSESNMTFLSVRVDSLPNCESVISKFYAGTAVAGMGFPMGHYAYYFQFGVVSNKPISETQWSARLRDPRILRKTGWNQVETAWTIQGDRSYLDYDWMWGGAPYLGVNAEYYHAPFEDPYEVVFSYTGETLPKGTVLWETGISSDRELIPPTVANQPLGGQSMIIISSEIIMLCGLTGAAVYRYGLKKKAFRKGSP